MTQANENTYPYAYDAFLSYCHRVLDSAVTTALRTLLEAFRMPRRIAAAKHNEFRAFMDDVELSGSPKLGEMIEAAAKDSRVMFVICSRSTPDSEWIEKEIGYFLRKNAQDFSRIYPVLIEGTPDEAFPAVLLKRHREAPLDYLDITAPTQPEVLENLKEAQLWLQSRMAGVPEALLERQLRKSRIQRWVAGVALAAVLLTLVTTVAAYFMRQAQDGRDTAAAMLLSAETSRENAQESRLAAQASAQQALSDEAAAIADNEKARQNETMAEQSKEAALQSRALAQETEAQALKDEAAAVASEEEAEQNRQAADRSRAAAQAYTVQADADRELAEQRRAAADQSQRASLQSEADARESEASARAYQQAFEDEQARVLQAEADYAENEIWARIVQYEMDLENLRPLQARSYAQDLLAEKGLTQAQRIAAQAIIDRTFPDTRLSPVYREEGERFAGYSPDGATLITGAGDGSLNSYDAQSLRLLGQVKTGGHNMFMPVFTTDSQYMALSSFDGEDTISIYDTRTLARVRSQDYIDAGNLWEGQVWSANFAPGTHDLYYCHGYLGMFRMSPEGVEPLEMEEALQYNSVLTISPDTFIFSRYRYEYPSPYDPETASYVYHAKTGRSEPLGDLGEMYKFHTAVVESTDGRFLGIGNLVTNGIAYVFDRETGKLVWQGEAAQHNAMFGFSGDSRKMLFGIAQGGVSIHNLGEDFHEVGHYSNFDGKHAQVAQLCLDWNAILFAYDTTLVLGDIGSNEILEKVETAHSTRIQKIVVSPGGYQAVTISDTEAIFWELR